MRGLLHPRAACRLVAAATAIALLAAAAGCAGPGGSVVENDAESLFVRGTTFEFEEVARLDGVAGDFCSFVPGEVRAATGIGVVVCLDDTGDKGSSFEETLRFLQGIEDLRIPPDAVLEEGKTALVMVEAAIARLSPEKAALAGASVRPLGNAESLENGVLIPMNLVDPGSGRVLAIAMGPVLITTVDSSGESVRTPKYGRLLRVGIPAGGEPELRRIIAVNPFWPELVEAVAEAVRKEFPKARVEVLRPNELDFRIAAEQLDDPRSVESRIRSARFSAPAGNVTHVLVDRARKKMTTVGKRLHLGRGTFLLEGRFKVVSLAGKRICAPPDREGLSAGDAALVEALDGADKRPILTLRWLKHVVRVLDRLGADFDDAVRLVSGASGAGALTAELLEFLPGEVSGVRAGDSAQEDR